MCNLTGIAFGQRVLQPADVAGRGVLEVGSLDVNGSIRPFVESLQPGRYVGVDIAPGPRVDEVVDASKLIERFGAESFDVVITTEMLEHIRPWRIVIHNLKGVLRPGGVLLVTTRSIGFPYHGYPHDFWRYEPEDMRAIFADFEIDTIERDTDSPGIFVLARKPTSYAEKRPSLELFSIVTGRRQARISTFELAWFRMTRSL
ncbi:MAG TPA: class I SAM-dependent methyltransferase, partial [Patescibacteria group bacterium]|nr:class I SAM-dependent methyltransferase [Patescibacteria group bacterium]